MSVSPWIAKLDELAAAINASKLLLVEQDRQLNYGEFFTRVNQTSSFIRDFGLNLDDRVIISTRDTVSLMFVFFACLRSGVTSVILDPGASVLEAQTLANVADVRAVFADTAFLERTGIRDALPNTVAFVKIARAQAKPAGVLGRLLGRKSDTSSAPDTFPAMLDTVAADNRPATAPAADTLAYILFTSGTTSRPKGVEISHQNLFAQERTFVRHYGLDARTQLLNVLPMFHTDGLTHGPVLALFAGGTLHRPISQFRVDLLPHLIRSIYTLQVTHFITVPAVLSLLHNLAEDFSEVFTNPDFRFIISTAAYLDPKLWRNIKSRFGVRTVNVYGLTETVCEALYCGPDDETSKIGTVGKPVDFAARIVDDASKDVAQGQVGELILKGDNVMRGYFRQPKETAEVLSNGWFHTGDLAKIDDEGFYSIVGRKKDVIITAGINVYPEDVTAVIRSMPDVVDAVTFGLNDDVWGERVVSCVQASDENVTIEAVAAHCGANLSREKLPNKIFIFPDFPRGPAGKVITSEIKELVYSEINNQAVIDPSASIGDQVRRIAARTFKMSFAAVTADTNPESAPGWNSLAHVEFLLDLEQQFGLRLGPREIMLIGSVGDAVRLVENTATMKSNGGDGATAG